MRWFGFSMEIRGAEPTMLRLVEEGETYRAIAKQYSASPTLFHDWRRRNPERKHKFDSARYRASARGRLEHAVEACGGFDTVLDELRRGVTAVEVVNLLRTTRGTLYRWLRDEPTRWVKWRSVTAPTH